MIGRPQSAEAAAYYFTYIDKVVGEDALAIIENQLQETARERISGKLYRFWALMLGNGQERRRR
ncbi:MAG: hypothetical protein JWN45_868 [Acidobacteriaceae bacterium]|jgi:hypothetical protein|nr:hypothetical protein [Acidobacteriaceae bacterium]